MNHRAAKQDADPLKRLPVRVVSGHGKTWRNRKLQLSEDKRKLALAQHELTSRNEGPPACVWPSHDFDVKHPQRSGDEEAASAVEQSHRWVYRV